jgi:arylsulfatase A-like enzyme
LTGGLRLEYHGETVGAQFHRGMEVAMSTATGGAADARRRESRPNIIWIMADDLSWADCGCYGQKIIRTPNIDALADDGIRFTQCYAGSTVCAPSRSCLMQGLHQGHATVRDNMLAGYRHGLQPEDTTVAAVCKEAGYATGLFGKWGLATPEQQGRPNAMGFDEFFGYLNQRHAHNYYPTHLWHNEERVPYPQHEGYAYREPREYDEDGKLILEGRMADPENARYSFDECRDRSLEFVRRHADEPFFLYLAHTPPHGVLVAPDLGPYADADLPHTIHKEWAAMVTRLDDSVGDLVALLRELDIYENTLIFFCSDNGYSPMGTVPQELIEAGIPDLDGIFHHRGPFRGGKGDLHEGAVRVPMIAHWPKKIQAGGASRPRVSELPWAFWDLMPTAAELVGADCPRTDGVSIVPTLVGDAERQQDRDYFYWEHFAADRLEQACRFGRYRAHRHGGPIEVYHAVEDGMEQRNLAPDKPELVEQAARIFEEAHQQSDYFPNPDENLEAWLARVERDGTRLLQNVGSF